MSKKIKIFLIAAAVLACIAAGTAIALSGRDTIYSGVLIAGVDVGGLTVDQAIDKLAPKADDLEAAEVTLKYHKESATCAIADLGGSADIESSVSEAYQIGREGNFLQRIIDIVSLMRQKKDIPVSYAFDKSKADEYIRNLAKEIDRQPQDARLDISGDSVQVIPERPGIALDVNKSVDKVFSSISIGTRSIGLVVAVAEPKVRADDLKDIDGVLASYSTKFKPWQKDRTYNLRLACEAIDGTILKPDEVFSYNKIVGPREKKFGFRDAPMFVKGEVEDGLGGGVCQVSSTVYNAALLSNMKIVRRSHHSRPVTYTPVGRDATVAYPYVDFKFSNSTGAPVYISAKLGKNTVNISIFGRKQSEQKVEIVTSGHKVISAPVSEVVDEKLEPGKRTVKESGRSGHRVSTYRVVTENGKVIKRELISNDYYKPEKRIVLVAKPASEPEQAEL